jgi:hypothetical protein
LAQIGPLLQRERETLGIARMSQRVIERAIPDRTLRARDLAFAFGHGLAAVGTGGHRRVREIRATIGAACAPLNPA